jgi:hypothetical protein
MRRGLLLLALAPGCSLVLDFSDKAIPKDAAIDGPYTADECAYKEPNDTPNTAQMITTADTGPAAICMSDPADFYKFSIAGASKVTVSISFIKRTGGDLDLEVDDTTGNTLASSRGVGSGESITCPGQVPACPSLADGDYLMRVFPGVTGDVNAYTFSLQIQ